MQIFVNGMRPIHPGEVFVMDYLRASGLSLGGAAQMLGIPYEHLLMFSSGKQGLTVDLANRLERAFGGEAQGWINLQATYEQRLLARSGTGAGGGRSCVAKQILPQSGTASSKDSE